MVSIRLLFLLGFSWFWALPVFADDCPLNLYLRCSYDDDEYFLRISGSDFVAIDVNPTIAKYAVREGSAWCSTRFNKWKGEDQEFIDLSGAGLVNRTLGTYEPNDYTNVNCKKSDRASFTAALAKVKETAALDKAKEQEQLESVQAKRKF